MRSDRITSIALAGLLGLGFSACSSSSKTTSEPATTVGTTPGPVDESCPFSGSTDSQREPGGAATTELSKVEPATQGCVDNVMFNFSPTLAPSVTAYESPAPSGGGAILVVTLQHTTLGSGLKTGTTLNPKNLNYVSKVELTESSGNVVWHVTLDKQRPFLVSSSNVPAQLVIAVG